MIKSLKIIFKGLKHYRNYRQFSRFNSQQQSESSFSQSLVKDMIGLGPVFIKLGQILSTRSDLMPSHYIAELKQLQEHVPAMNFTDVSHIIEAEFGKSVVTLFESFDEKPIASASLAQVHFAKLATGDEIAVKIQKNGVFEVVESDLNRLHKLLQLLNLLFAKKVKRLNLFNGFLEFKRYTLQELDYENEAKTIARFKQNFITWKDILFPKVYDQLSTKKVLCMSRIQGMRLNEAQSVLTCREKEKLNIRLAELELKMFITDGLFHADLHPGNRVCKLNCVS